MSAIVGVVRLDEAPLQSNMIDLMLHAVRHRCVDGVGRLCEGSVGLGFGKLGASAESATAQNAVARLGGTVVVADIRLDNRDDLLRALGLPVRSVTDETILLAAYDRWSDHCVEHLLGDFAFAIWDQSNQRLFCARDHFGVKSLFYAASPTFFAFATEIKALFALPFVNDAVREESYGEFLVGRTNDREATLYAHVKRLLPAHTISVSRTQVQTRQYWRLETGEPPIGTDFTEQFREAFQTAVARRIQGATRLGAMLSGGLDSSAVACMAAKLRSADTIRTYSQVFDETPQINERKWIEQVLAWQPFKPAFISCDRYAHFKDFDVELRKQDGLFFAAGLAMGRPLYERAAQDGVRVLLDGHGGDEVLGYCTDRLDELAKAGAWLRLWREASGVAGIFGGSPWRSVYPRLLLETRVGRFWARAQRTLKRGRRRLSKLRRRSKEGNARYMAPEFATRFELAKKSQASPSRSDGYIAFLSNLGQDVAFEVLDRAAAAHQIEVRYPFWDKQLVELCASLPPSQRLQDRWPRFILRRAMEGILPPAIQWRRDKFDFGPHLARGIVDHHAAQISEILSSDRLGVYLDLHQASKAFDRLVRDKASGSDIGMVWRFAALGIWLEAQQGGARAFLLK